MYPNMMHALHLVISLPYI